jgi:hypothetical protein
VKWERREGKLPLFVNVECYPGIHPEKLQKLRKTSEQPNFRLIFRARSRSNSDSIKTLIVGHHTLLGLLLIFLNFTLTHIHVLQTQLKLRVCVCIRL